MATEYTTDHIAPRARFEYWRDAICDAYLPILCETPDNRHFDGSISLERLSQLDLSIVKGSPQHIKRGRSEIRRNADAFFMLSLQLSDTCHLSQAGRTATLRPGDFALYSTDAPYEILCENNVGQLVVQLPYDALLARLPHAHGLLGCAVSAQSGVGALVSAQLQDCARLISGQSEPVKRHMQDMIMDVIVTGLSTLSDGRIELNRGDHMVLARAKTIIRDHLKDASLNPGIVARMMGMSTRNLARIFARENQSIAAYIRHVRMQAIADDLVDPRMVALSITEIAFKWGMNNLQHFSKLFKDTHGLSPRAYRQTRRVMQ